MCTTPQLFPRHLKNMKYTNKVCSEKLLQFLASIHRYAYKSKQNNLNSSDAGLQRETTITIAHAYFNSVGWST